MIALEDLERGKRTEDRYYPGERVPVRYLKSGDVFLGRISESGSFDQGDWFESAGTSLGQMKSSINCDKATAFAYDDIEAGIPGTYGRLVPLVMK